MRDLAEIFASLITLAAPAAAIFGERAELLKLTPENWQAGMAPNGFNRNS